MKYEVKGVDEEMKAEPDVDKRIEQMDEHDEDFEFDDDDEDIPEIGQDYLQKNISFEFGIFHLDDNDDENGKNAGDDLSDVGKLLKSDAVSKGIMKKFNFNCSFFFSLFRNRIKFR